MSAHFLTILRPTRANFPASATDEERAIVARHFEYLQNPPRGLTVLMAGRTDEASPMGLVVFVADSLEHAEAFALGDPAVRDGVFQAEVHPYLLALCGQDYPSEA
ncbi:MAG TPA: YciI family protein [Fimbriimonadaceae bacterium]|nr:YciI family protein [Fimbriimonadaceae bacterium]